MGRKHNRAFKNKIIFKVVVFPLIIFFSYLSIKLGIAAGNFVYDMDFSFVESIDTENFKTIFKKSIPLIETVYNSGHVDISITGEIKSAVEAIFGFDLNLPLSIFNAQSPLFSFYYRNYQMSLMQENTENGHGYHWLDYEQENKEESNKTALNDQQGADHAQPIFQEAVSSITYEETEEKDIDSSDMVSAGKISIRNETKYKIDEAEIKKLLREPLKFSFDKKKNKVLIYHSHTTEGYLKNLSELQKSTTLNRTRDTRYNVVRVGDELTQQLKKKYGIDVLHNGNVHDYPYNSSYANSLKTITQYLKSHPSIKLLFDIHRDGLSSGSPKLRVTKTINGKVAAQIMFVVGTDSTGLNHPQWRENLKLAVKLQEKLNERAPGLAKPIYISKNRYNHHVSPGTLTVEIGGDGNLVGEALESVKYLAAAINDVIK